MISILFVCLGNICRSPMAESVMAHLIQQAGLSDQITVASAGTSDEESGHGVHPGTRKVLAAHEIPVVPHHAVQMDLDDYKQYDYIIAMEQRNIHNMHRLLGGDPQHKMRLLLDWSSRPRDIADPWYTGNFTQTYDDVQEGCKTLLEHLRTKFSL